MKNAKDIVAAGKAIDRRWNWGACLLLIAAAVVVFGKGITVGGLRFSDACTHAMDGVLIHDWWLSGPNAWRHPMEFAIRQYAHFPTLGIGRVYPPGFSVVEAAFFLMFGVSPVVSRLCVVCFAIAGLLGCYFLARRASSRLGAFCAAACLLAMPCSVTWSRQTMLEMPTLAVLIWGVLATLAYMDRPTLRRLVFCTLFVLGAPLFKQTAAFVVPVLGIALLVRAWRRQVPWAHVVIAGVAVTVPLGAYLGWSLVGRDGGTHMLDVVTMGKSLDQWLAWRSLTYYVRATPYTVGLPVLMFAAVGAVLGLTRRRIEDWILLGWFVVFLAMVTLIQHKETRYFFFGLGPVAIWFGMGMDRLSGAVQVVLARVLACRRSVLADTIPQNDARMARIAALGSGLCVACVGLLVTSGYRTPIEFQPDYAPMLTQHADALRNRIVLFEGHRDGDFTFAARRVLGPRGCVVMRGSKLFYSCAAMREFDYTSYVANRRDIRAIISELGIDTIFVERRNVFDLEEVDLLHEELADSQRYQRIATHRLAAPMTTRSRRTRDVDVFRPAVHSVRTVRFVNIPVPIDSRTLRVDLDELLTPEI